MKQNVTRMIHLARGHVEAGGIRAAEVYYRHVLKACDAPTSAVDRLAMGEACRFFGGRAIAAYRHGEACDWYQRALFADPLAVEYMVEFVVRALLPMTLYRMAKIIATRATRIEPDNKDAWRALGIACAALCEPEESVAAYEMQLSLDPENPLTLIDRGSIAINTGDYDTAQRMAIAIFDGGAKWSKHWGDAHHLAGLVHYRRGEHEAAISRYDDALHIGSHDDAQVRWNKSLAEHSIGRYRSGWANSEYRGEQKGDEPMRIVMNRFQRPRMKPADLKTPQRVHVHHEMGNGDAFAMARYLDLLTGLGHTVTLETLDSMAELLQHSFPAVTVIPRALDYPGTVGLPDFDVHVPMLSLPALFNTDIDTVPWRGPYIKAETKFGPMSGDVGVCWSSGIRTDGLWISEYGRRKSMHFDTFRPIVDAIRAAGKEPISLQVGPERMQGAGSVNDCLSGQPDWNETANVIADLGLVITVDTAVAHLAGAMGKPVWVLCQRDGASWHFMRWTEGAMWNTRSPWYPSARVFRQREFNRPHQWAEVVAEVAAEIAVNADAGSDRGERQRT